MIVSPQVWQCEPTKNGKPWPAATLPEAAAGSNSQEPRQGLRAVARTGFSEGEKHEARAFPADRDRLAVHDCLCGCQQCGHGRCDERPDRGGEERGRTHHHRGAARLVRLRRDHRGLQDQISVPETERTRPRRGLGRRDRGNQGQQGQQGAAGAGRDRRRAIVRPLLQGGRPAAALQGLHLGQHSGRAEGCGRATGTAITTASSRSR